MVGWLASNVAVLTIVAFLLTILMEMGMNRGVATRRREARPSIDG